MNTFLGKLDDLIIINKIDLENAKLILDNNCKRKKYIIGKNNDAINLINIVDFTGIIDDFSPIGQKWQNLNLVKMSSLGKDDLVVNCSTSISPISVNNNLKLQGILSVVDYYIFNFIDNNIPKSSFIISMEDTFNKNIEKFEKVFNLLNDELSKETFKNVLKYRLTGNPLFMNNFKIRLAEQYIENFMNYKNEIYVDAGGYDGDSIIEFCLKFPDYKKVYFFEPSLINLEKAKKRLKNISNINFIDYGLSDKNQILNFNSFDGSASSISDSGDTQIKVTTLDECIVERVSTIKMDIEGWELNALKGCQNHIEISQPKLAIAVYHKSEDFFEIPYYILGLKKDYDLYLRHYTEGWSETVMYFVPKN